MLRARRGRGRPGCAHHTEERYNAERSARAPGVRDDDEDATASPDDLREAVTMLEETERTARRVLGGAHPLTMNIEGCLRNARAALSERETPPTNA